MTHPRRRLYIRPEVVRSLRDLDVAVTRLKQRTSASRPPRRRPMLQRNFRRRRNCRMLRVGRIAANDPCHTGKQVSLRPVGLGIDFQKGSLRASRLTIPRTCRPANCARSKNLTNMASSNLSAGSAKTASSNR